MGLKFHSLKNRILFYLFLIVFGVFLLTEITIVEKSRRSFIKISDKAITAYALSVASQTEVDSNGAIRWKASDEIMRDFTRDHPHAHFAIFRIADNSEVWRSESLKNVKLSLPETVRQIPRDKPEFWNEQLNGKDVRFVALRRFVRSEREEGAESEAEDSPRKEDPAGAARRSYSTASTGTELLFVAGLDNSYVNERYEQSIETTAPVLGVGLLLTLVLGWITIERSLKPLQHLDREVRSISSSNMSPVNVPEVKEIATVAMTLNRVIEELKEAFERERRFTANVAHELRTPISEIRSLSEVALKWGDSLDHDNRDNYSDILASAKEMQRTVTNLLTLARYQSGHLTHGREEVELEPLVNSIWREHADVAAGKRITVHCDVPSQLFVVTDQYLLQTILQNLFSNAVSYTPEGGTIEWKADTKEGTFSFSISNSVEGLSSNDLPYLFEPFWRKDEARTSGHAHSGLGLSLIQSLSSVLGLAVDSRLTTPTTLMITLTGKAAERAQFSSHTANKP